MGVGIDIDNNRVPDAWYTDVTLRYRFEALGSKSEAYLTVNNLFDQIPPALSGASTFVQETDASRYDVLGTYFTAGLRFRF